MPPSAREDWGWQVAVYITSKLAYVLQAAPIPPMFKIDNKMVVTNNNFAVFHCVRD